MHRRVYRFAFTEGTDMQEVEDTLILAILAVGCLCGEPAIRLDAGYAINREQRAVAVDGTTETGRAVTRVFTGLSIHEYGDESFSVARSDDPLPASPRAAAADPEPACAS